MGIPQTRPWAQEHLNRAACGDGAERDVPMGIFRHSGRDRVAWGAWLRPWLDMRFST